MALDTLANVKTSLLISGTADDAVLTRLMDAAEAFVADYTGRAFAGGTFTETHPAGSELTSSTFGGTRMSACRTDCS